MRRARGQSHGEQRSLLTLFVRHNQHRGHGRPEQKLGNQCRPRREQRHKGRFECRKDDSEVDEPHRCQRAHPAEPRLDGRQFRGEWSPHESPESKREKNRQKQVNRHSGKRRDGQRTDAGQHSRAYLACDFDCTTGRLRCDQPDPRNFRAAAGEARDQYEGQHAPYASIAKAYFHAFFLFHWQHYCKTGWPRLRSAEQTLCGRNDSIPGILCLSWAEDYDLDQQALVMRVWPELLRALPRSTDGLGHHLDRAARTFGDDTPPSIQPTRAATVPIRRRIASAVGPVRRVLLSRSSSWLTTSAFRSRKVTGSSSSRSASSNSCVSEARVIARPPSPAMTV